MGESPWLSHLLEGNARYVHSSKLSWLWTQTGQKSIRIFLPYSVDLTPDLTLTTRPSRPPSTLTHPIVFVIICIMNSNKFNKYCGCYCFSEFVKCSIRPIGKFWTGLPSLQFITMIS